MSDIRFNSWYHQSGTGGVIQDASGNIGIGTTYAASSLVVIGDGRGHIGVGLGKANEVISSISKAKDNAKRNIFKAKIINGTIPHKIVGKYGSSRVLLKPASQGTGIIAGGPVRAVMEQVGINNILSKRYGSTIPLNIVRATINALENLQDAVLVANKRGMTIKELFG